MVASMDSADVLQQLALHPASFAGPEENAAASNNEDAVLKLKGLPYATTEAQIYEFFADYKVKTVAFVSEPDGRPSGLAFAEFESKEEALKALSRNGEYIGERYVRLLHVPKSEMEEQVRLGTLAIPGAAAKLRSRLLRTQMQQARLATGAYLAGPQLLVPTPQVLMQAAGPGRPLLMHPHQHVAAAAAAAGQAATLLAASAGAYPTGSGTPVGAAPTLLDGRTLWHNYPTATSVPLHQQFASLGLGPADGPSLSRPSPAAPFSLLTPLSAAAAVGSSMTSAGVSNGTTPAYSLGQPSSSSTGAASSSYLTTSTPHASTANSNQQLVHGAADGVGLQGAQRPSHGGGGAQLGGGVAFAAAQRHAGPVAQFAGGAVAAGGPLMLGGYGTGALGQLGGGVGLAPDMPLAGVGSTSVAQRASLLSTTSATVKMRGLPYRSSPSDILGFFAGYQYLPDSLQLGLDAGGRPSGEAWLTFASPAEAARAVRELNRHYLGARYLELSVC